MFIERPEISVILLTYNRPGGLKKAVESIYAQTFKKFELIILDNGNSLDYPEVIQEYFTKDNLRYIRFEENELHLGKRLNQGLSVANGKYVTFLMDDDTWDKNALKNLHGEISKDLDFVFGKVKSIDSTTGKQVRNTYGTSDWRMGSIKKLNPIHITAVMIKRDLFNKIGGFHDGVKRSYDLNLWNRIFQESKCKRVDKIISHISVNNLSSVTGSNRAESSAILSEYPLVGYWSERKSISFLGNEQKFIDQINSRHQSWVATQDYTETEAIVTWGYSPDTDSHIGDGYYYIDHPSLVQDPMLEWCDGVITQFPFETEKPHHLIRPTISHDEMRQADKIYYNHQNNLRILCPKINEDNLDFICVLMDYVADRYSAVIFHYYPDNEVRALLGEIPNVILTELQEDSYEYFKKQGIDVVLHVNGDTNSYVDAYKAFLIGSAVKAPLVSSPNIAFGDILKHEEDLFIVDTLQKFVWSIDKAKDLSVREIMIRSIRKKTLLYFLDQVVLDQFTLFLNDNHKTISREVVGTVSVEQLESNSSVIIHSGEFITQSFIAKTSTFNGIQFFGNVLSNTPGQLRFVLKKGEDLLIEKNIPSHALKNGVNTILFGDILESQGVEFSFTLYGDAPVFKLDYTNAVMSSGTYYSNNLPKKACSKFKVLQEAYVTS